MGFSRAWQALRKTWATQRRVASCFLFPPYLKGPIAGDVRQQHIFNMQDRTCVILLHKGSKRFRWFAKSANTPEPQRVIVTICCAVICRIHGMTHILVRYLKGTVVDADVRSDVGAG